jgi:hypothetical protein
MLAARGLTGCDVSEVVACLSSGREFAGARRLVLSGRLPLGMGMHVMTDATTAS